MGNTHPERGAIWGSKFVVEVRPGKYSSGERCIQGNTHQERGAFWGSNFLVEVRHGKYSSGERCILW